MQARTYLVERIRVLREVVCKKAMSGVSLAVPVVLLTRAAPAKKERSRTPEHVGILEVRLRVSLLSVDKVRELGWVAQEEHWRVVLHDGGENSCQWQIATAGEGARRARTYVDMVPVALLSPELDGETTGVSCRVGGSALATDGREPSSRACLVADLAEELGASQV